MIIVYGTPCLFFLKNIEESPELRAMWDKYRRQFAYAEGIEYASILKEIRNLII